MFNETCDFEEKRVQNIVKRVLRVDSLKSGERNRMEKAIRRVAHRVYMLMQKHCQGEEDVATTLDSLASVELHVQLAAFPRTLGRPAARQVFEQLVGHGDVLDPTLEYVNHPDKPGMPAPVNLFTISPNQSGDEANEASESDGSQCSMDSYPEAMSAAGAASTSVIPQSIVLLEFARSPKQFLHALQYAPELEECRRAMSSSGCPFTVKGGAKVFVRPERYAGVMKAIQGKQLKPRHVIIADEFEDLLELAIHNIGKGVKTKSKAFIPPEPMVEKRTFLEVPLPSSLRSDPRSDPATVSTSDADPRKNNPRRAVPREVIRRRYCEAGSDGESLPTAANQERSKNASSILGYRNFFIALCLLCFAACFSASFYFVGVGPS